MLKSEYELLSNDELILHIEKCVSNWQSLSKQTIKNGVFVRDYFNNIQTQRSQITPGGDLKSIEVVATSFAKNSLNRIKTDFRDLYPSFQVAPKSIDQTNDKRKIVQSLLNALVITNKNVSNIFRCADDLVDCGVCVIRIDVEQEYDKKFKSIKNCYKLSRVNDLTDVYFDCDVEFEQINDDGHYCGYAKTITFKDDDSVYRIEHFEKIFDEVEYGKKYSAANDNYIWEILEKGSSYFDTTKIKELVAIRHIIVENSEIKSNKVWRFGDLPLLIKGMAIDKFNDKITDRLTIIPYAEHVIDAQKKLDYAESIQMYNLKMTRGTTKATYTSEMIEGYEDEWANRNIVDTDLHYNLITDPITGNYLPLKPEFVTDVPLSPIVSEIVSSGPMLINSLLGTNLEQDITYNMSGEAINKMQIVRSKNSKIYSDLFIEFMNDIGKRIQNYLSTTEKDPRVLTIDNYGEAQPILVNAINQQNPSESYFIPEILNKYNVSIVSGKGASAANESTILSLSAMYQSYAQTQLGEQIQSSTADIYASSLPTPESYEISRRIKPFVPKQTRDLSDGEISIDQIDQQNQQSAQAQQQMQQQMMQMQQQISQLMAQAKMMESQADMKKAEADMIDAEADIQKSQDSVQTSKIKANAEVVKALKTTGDNTNEK